MDFLADYHTHTVYSHGTGTVLQNAVAAKEKGLLQIGISDHGFAHPFFGVKKRSLESMRADCTAATAQTGVQVLMGVESNFVDKHGNCDLTEDFYDKFDIFLAGAHVCVKYKDLSSWWNVGFWQPTVTKFGGTAEGRSKAFMTDLYVNAVTRQPIDVITHLDYRVFADVAEVARCCAKYGTYIEINTKKSHMTDEQWRAVYETGVNFIIGSDAHSPSRVADIAPALELMRRVGIEETRVHNLGRLPRFRFAEYKGVKL